MILFRMWSIMCGGNLSKRVGWGISQRHHDRPMDFRNVFLLRGQMVKELCLAQGGHRASEPGWMPGGCVEPFGGFRGRWTYKVGARVMVVGMKHLDSCACAVVGP